MSKNKDVQSWFLKGKTSDINSVTFLAVTALVFSFVDPNLSLKPFKRSASNIPLLIPEVCSFTTTKKISRVKERVFFLKEIIIDICVLCVCPSPLFLLTLMAS